MAVFGRGKQAKLLKRQGILTASPHRILMVQRSTNMAPTYLPIWPLTVFYLLVKPCDKETCGPTPKRDEAWKAHSKRIMDILEKHGIEYADITDYQLVAITGKLVLDECNTEGLVLAALEIRDWLNQKNAEDGAVQYQFRMGIHTDNVVAGIIASAKMSYGLYSHAKHVAHRMARCAGNGNINLSEYTYAHIHHMVDCEYWGAIDSMGEIHRPSKHIFDKARRNIPHIRTGWLGMYCIKGKI